MKKIYLASSLNQNNREYTKEVVEYLRNKGYEVYSPIEHKLPHDWDYTNNEWGLMVFTSDINAINESDLVIGISEGRNSTAGANWELGYAYGIGKKVIIVEKEDVKLMSLMVANGRYATVKGIEGLKNYDLENLPVTRTKTEQK